MNEPSKKFRTKTGYCHILTDKIVLTRSETIGEFSKIAAGNNVYRIVVINAIITTFLAYTAFQNFGSGNISFGILWSAFALFFFYNIVNSLQNSAAPVIYRNQIEEITYVPLIRFLRRAYFVVRFKDTQGVSKKRLILLPGSLNKGEEEAEIAVLIMMEEGLLK
ncbi:MAG: hypothetical protein ACPG49_10905 [Chitinophagales bacterium]